MIRAPLMVLANGGPYRRWRQEDVADDASASEGIPQDLSPTALCQLVCARVRSLSVHVDLIDDELERFAARVSVFAKERIGIATPHHTEASPGFCRHFATSVSHAYGSLARYLGDLDDTVVVFVMGIPACAPEQASGLHAWNWLIDFSRGTINAFDPQNDRLGDRYANASSLLYTFAALRSGGCAVPGLPLLVRRADSVYGGTVLFHLARHPIARASRWKIITRLRNAGFDRVVADWERELEAWDSAWGSASDLNVDEIIHLASG